MLPLVVQYFEDLEYGEYNFSFFLSKEETFLPIPITEKPLLSKSVDTASPIVPVDPMTMTFLMLSPNFSQPQ